MDDVTQDRAQAMAIIDRLRAFSGAMDHYLHVRGGAHGLHRTDLVALGHVLDATRGGRALTPGELAAALNLSSPATSALLARLESVGHVQRSHSTTDRRKVSVEMTDGAMAVAGAVFSPIGATMISAIDAYSAQEKGLILRFLDDVLDATAAATGSEDDGGGGS